MMIFPLEHREFAWLSQVFLLKIIPLKSISYEEKLVCYKIAFRLVWRLSSQVMRIFMLRSKIKTTLKDAMKSKDKRKTSTLRLIIATLQDRDLAARDKGAEEGITEDEILQMLTTMVRQRKESIAAYEKGGRIDLATSEQEEIDIISEFLPKQFDDAEIRSAVNEVISEIDAQGLKDMGKTMAALKVKYAGRMDFSVASVIVKETLGA
jgi:uncharacterized protein